jgi:two-component system NarL family response regulator
VLLVDDHPIVRSGLACALKRRGFEIAGVAGDGRAAIHQYFEARPDVVLMDLSLPVLDGWQAIEQIRDRDPGARILALSAFRGDEDIARALALGAQGYLLKDCDEDELIAAVETVHSGRRAYGAGIAEAVASRLGAEPLSGREVQVLEAVASGKTNKEIAVQYRLSESTVKGHLNNILSKLGVDDRTAAVVVAHRRGIIHL